MTGQIQEPYREVAAAILIGTCGRLLFQQRDDIPGLLYAGQVGLFGGHREGQETPLECLQRELLEETGHAVEAERCQPFVSFRALYPGGGGVVGEYYIVRGMPIDGLTITEGSPLIVKPEQLPALLPRMTPSACYAARLFLEFGKHRR